MLGPSTGSATLAASITNPVEYISVRTTSRAPARAAASIIGARRGEVRVAVRPHDVVLNRRDLHRCKPFTAAVPCRAADGLFEHLQALAEGEADERQAGFAVVVEDDVGNGHHAAPLGERSAEREAVGLAEGADVGRDEVGAGRRHHREAGGGQAVGEQVAPLAETGGDLGEVRVGQVESDRDRVLERRRVDIGEELLGGADRCDERRRAARPADLPTRERERLPTRRDRERPLAHPGERRQRHVLAVVDEVLVDLVGHGEEVVLDAEPGDQLELVAREHLPGRVVGRVEEDHRVRGPIGRLECGRVEPVVGRSEGDDAPLGAGHGDRRGVRVVVRLEGHDLVADLAERRAWPRRSLRSRRRSRGPRCRRRAPGRRSGAGGARWRRAARGSPDRAGTGCDRPGWRRRPRRRRPRGRRCRESPGPG